MWTDYVMEAVLDRQPSAAPLRGHASALSLAHRLVDALLILGGLWLTCRLAGVPWSAHLALSGATAVVLFNLLAEFKGLYRSWRTESILRELLYTLESSLGVAGASLLTFVAQQNGGRELPEALLYWLVGMPLLLVLWRLVARFALRLARRVGFNSRSLAIAGSGELARHVARTVQESPWMGYQVVGLFDDSARDEHGAVPRGRSILRLERMVGMAREGALDAVFIALPPGDPERRAGALVERLSDSTASLYLVQDRRSRSADGEQGSRQVVPDLWRVDLLRRHRVDVAGIKAVSLYESPFLGVDGWVKRVEDILVSVFALLLLALPMAIVALGVKLSGRGPVLFKQRRYGLDGREIMVWKFRSMTVCEDGARVAQARRGDARVTPFGAFLRRTSLDELPQFFNVLLGSMSVVGPRPHAVAHNEYYRGRIGGYMLRHKVKPGITGWAQVNGWRGETDSVDKMGRRVDYDLDYIRNWSIWLDLWIILLTAFKGFVHRNAY